MGSSAWVLGLALGLVAVHTVSATNYTLGGSAGWTDTVNINYTEELAPYTIKVGDTLIFINYDIHSHSVVQVPIQADYDACDSIAATDTKILLPGDSASITFLHPHAELYIICDYHCVYGQKVKLTVANADGTPASGSPPTGPTASPPSSTPADTTPDTTAASPPPPATRSNATTSNPLNSIARNDAAGIARFGWFTLTVMCALSCYNIL